jgi:single-strand DNA-binding protein
MNKAILMGRLTKDPDVKYTQTGKVVTQFTLAVDRPFKDANGNKETDFIPVVVWGKAAELVGNSCQKGHRLLVDGRLQIRSYDAKDGTKRWVTEIIANGVEFVERKSDKGGTSGDKSEFEQFGHAVPFDEDNPF